MEEVKERPGISRRHFIAGAAVMGVGGALAGCAPQSPNLSETGKESDSASVEVPETQIFSGGCRANCAGGCFLDIHVRDGQIVRTTAREMPNPEYNRICSRGVTQVARVYSAKRLQYPMRRVGERGEGKFERISWDEALNEIAEKWKGYWAEFGQGSVALFGGSGNYAVCSGTGLGAARERFRNVMGLSTINYNADAAHILTWPHVGTSQMVCNNESADFGRSQTIICWGANPAVSQPQIMHFIFEMQDRGGKYVVIDPIFNANASKADMWIPLNSATDGALAFGVLRTIFEKGWEDAEFLAAHSNGCFLIKEDDTFLRMSDLGVAPTKTTDETTGEEVEVNPYAVWDNAANAAVPYTEVTDAALTGIADVNGIKVRTVLDNLKATAAEWTPERVEEVCGVPDESVQELARIYHEEGPVNTYAQYGDDHYVNGHYNYWPIYAVAMVTGNLAKPGAGVGYPSLMPSTCNIMEATFPANAAGEPCMGPGPAYNMNQINKLLDEGIYAGVEAIPLKSVYLMCVNPLTTFADHDYTVEWFKKIDFVVVADQTMTETAKYADILLPSAHWFETTDLCCAYAATPYVLLQEKAIDPLYESRPDFDILKDLAGRLGFGEYFDMTNEDYIKLWLESDFHTGLGVTFERFMEEKAVNILERDPYVAFEGGNFLTETGRCVLYRETMTPQYDIGQEIDFSKELAPYWEPAYEADMNAEVRKKYPFQMLSDHMRTRTHSQWWDVDLLKEYEPEPVVRMHPAVAKEKGIQEGDEVRVFNDRGYVIMKAVIDGGHPRHILSAPRSFQAEEFIDGHYASLPHIVFNQVCSNQAYNDVAVDIEKA